MTEATLKETISLLEEAIGSDSCDKILHVIGKIKSFLDFIGNDPIHEELELPDLIELNKELKALLL